MNLKRSLAGSATLVVALSMTGCGGGGVGGIGGGAPEDASAEDFCKSFADAGSLDDDASSDEQAKQFNELGEKMDDVGTPEDIEESARNGFEVMVDVFSDLDGDTVDELDKLGGDNAEVADALGISEDEVKDMETFIQYQQATCSQQPSDDSGSDTEPE